MKIGLDAMGGDFAPLVTVQGAIAALEELSSGSTIVLYGDATQINEHLGAISDSRIEVVHTTEVIEMSDHPAQAFLRKTDSSITVGFNHLMQGRIDGFASAGSTGAMMVGCIQVVKPIEGVIRPTIASDIMTFTGRPVTVLDVGLNADCKPEVLYQYAVMGSIYSREVPKTSNPRVALLNIGEEESKGNLLAKATYPLLATNEGVFNFVGNVEGKHVFDGSVADVVVCDGFMGNTVLKIAEGFYDILKDLTQHQPLIENWNYETTGGTPVLGINSNVVVGHGCSSSRAIKNMILVTERTIKGDLVEKIKQAFA